MEGLINRLKGKDIKPHAPPVDHDKDSLLARDVPESFHISVQVLLFVLINISHCTRLRMNFHLCREAINPVPDVSLIPTIAHALLQGLVNGRSFLRPEAMAHDVSGFRKGRSGISPPSLLGTADRDNCL